MKRTPIRYAQCWEDADVLIEAMQVEPSHSCLAIASAGDNVLALLSRSPQRVVALDYNASQIACLELRVAAYRALDDEALLRFSGARPATDRLAQYRRCRQHLSPGARSFWDSQARAIERGYLSAGRFESYLATFRTAILPLVHSPATIQSLFAPKSQAEREHFYDAVWNTWRWRAVFGSFFSRPVMQRLGRDPRYFRYANADLREHVQQRIRHAFVDLDPACNPYLQWALTGTYGDALPYALRPDNAGSIRANLDRLSWRACSLEDYLADTPFAFDRFALSDVFEYLDEQTYDTHLQRIVEHSAPLARLAYWNMLVPRMRPERLARNLKPDLARASSLHAIDKTFFYSRFVIEDVC